MSNQDQMNLFNKTFTDKINKKEFRIYLNSSLNNKKYYTIGYKNGNSYLGFYNSISKIFSIRAYIFTRYRNEYKIDNNITYDLVKKTLEINLNKTIKRLKLHFK